MNAESKEEQNRSRQRWAEIQLGSLTTQERWWILDYLRDWAKQQPGHRPDCECGECD